jgi:hypothetical protein
MTPSGPSSDYFTPSISPHQQGQQSIYNAYGSINTGSPSPVSNQTPVTMSAMPTPTTAHAYHQMPQYSIPPVPPMPSELPAGSTLGTEADRAELH